MKTCKKCGESLPLSTFNKKGEGLNARCKKCLGEDYRKAYKDKPERRRQVTDAVAKYKADLIQFVIELKRGKPCMDCGCDYPHYVMDFDHVKGEKEINVSFAARLGWSKKRILKEVAKCELVCANCHRERTHGSVAQR
jgi:hypothetical protein